MAIDNFDEYISKYAEGGGVAVLDENVFQRANTLANKDPTPIRRRDLIINVMGGVVEDFHNGEITQTVIEAMTRHINEILSRFTIPAINYPDEIIKTFPYIQEKL